MSEPLSLATPEITLESSDESLVEGFQWAKQQAFQYVFNGDSVGPWYEASLPGRRAFCMRDVAHQSSGAHMLGLWNHNLNMLYQFAKNISESRGWCSFWEITNDGKPAQVDYQNDQDFWYNLPANFDVLDCCYRQYKWTGETRYIKDSVFGELFQHTVADYVKHWDSNNDGVLEHLPQYGRRGIATYNEALKDPLVGGDMIAAQYAGYLAYSEIQQLRGNGELATQYLDKAEALKKLYNKTWWDEDFQIFYGLRRQDGSFDPSYCYESNFLPLYFGLVEDGQKTKAALFDLIRHNPHNVEAMSYIPEIFYKYQYDKEGYESLKELMKPDLPRREYPEVSFSVIGATVSGLMGMNPNSASHVISTLSHLTDSLGSVTVSNIPVFENWVSIGHVGRRQTTFKNQTGDPIRWEACFRANTERLMVNGMMTVAMHRLGPCANPVSFVEIDVSQGESITVALP